ncbi:MAG: hypothetical protein COA79_00555 [Planctomycetota bacterium]|nr:MAG: hypothetical protein COA79_00555 [Planctomycetota bacterium]
MKLGLILFFILNFTNLYCETIKVPLEIENKIYVELKKLENNHKNKEIVRNILKIKAEYVEEIIFKHIDSIEELSPKSIVPIVKILGHFNTHRAILTISKYAEPYQKKRANEEKIERTRHIRITAIKSILLTLSKERIAHTIKYIKDQDPIFQSSVLRTFRKKKILEGIVPAYQVFKNSSSEKKFNVKVDAASLIINLSKDPLMKNNVLLNMINDANIHMRKAGLALIPDGGNANDKEVRDRVIEIIKKSKGGELELACKSAGKLRISNGVDLLIKTLSDVKNPMTKWECLYALFLIKYDKDKLKILIKEQIDKSKTKSYLKGGDQIRFERLLKYVN